MPKSPPCDPELVVRRAEVIRAAVERSRYRFDSVGPFDAAAAVRDQRSGR